MVCTPHWPCPGIQACKARQASWATRECSGSGKSSWQCKPSMDMFNKCITSSQICSIASSTVSCHSLPAGRGGSQLPTQCVQQRKPHTPKVQPWCNLRAQGTGGCQGSVSSYISEDRQNQEQFPGCGTLISWQSTCTTQLPFFKPSLLSYGTLNGFQMLPTPCLEAQAVTKNQKQTHFVNLSCWYRIFPKRKFS